MVGFSLFLWNVFIGWHDPFKANQGKEQQGFAKSEAFISSVIICL
jgi:hypothetical protein